MNAINSDVGRMVRLLASQGIVPCAHNLIIWQHADGTGWTVEIDPALKHFKAFGQGPTLRLALVNLMQTTNRGADVSQENEENAG